MKPSNVEKPSLLQPPNINAIMFNYSKALAWLTEVHTRLRLFGPPPDRGQWGRLSALMKAITFKCHTGLPYRVVLLQELAFVGDVHSIATHSLYLQDMPDGEPVPTCCISFIYSGQLYYVSTWGCLTCTSLYFSSQSWSQRLQLFYADADQEQEELFHQTSCRLCFGTHYQS